MDRISLIFCIFSLIISLGLAALMFPYAVLPAERLVTNGQSVEAAEIPDINLGDFGVV